MTTTEYLCDPWETSSLRDIQSHHLKQGAELCCLLDAGFAPELGAHLLSGADSLAIALYEGTPLKEMQETGLFLLPWQTEGGWVASTWLESQIRQYAPAPMFSFIWHLGPARALGAHLRQYLEVKTPDDLQWPVRWGDARCLPDYARLAQTEMPDILSGFTAWAWVNRSGQLQVWHGQQGKAQENASPDRQSGATFVPISDEALAQLVAAGEPDELLMQAIQFDPGIAQLARPSQLLASMADLLQQNPDRKGVSAVERLILLMRQLRSRHTGADV